MLEEWAHQQVFRRLLDEHRLRRVPPHRPLPEQPRRAVAVASSVEHLVLWQQLVYCVPVATNVAHQVGVRVHVLHKLALHAADARHHLKVGLRVVLQLPRLLLEVAGVVEVLKGQHRRLRRRDEAFEPGGAAPLEAAHEEEEVVGRGRRHRRPLLRLLLALVPSATTRPGGCQHRERCAQRH